MLGQLKKRFYWPGCSDGVRELCWACARCAKRKSQAPKIKAKLYCPESLRPGYPMQIVCMYRHNGPIAIY